MALYVGRESQSKCKQGPWVLVVGRSENDFVGNILLGRTTQILSGGHFLPASVLSNIIREVENNRYRLTVSRHP